MNPRKGMAKGEESKEGLVPVPGALLLETAPVGPVLSQPQVVTGCFTTQNIWEDKNSKGGSTRKRAPTPNPQKRAFDSELCANQFPPES